MRINDFLFGAAYYEEYMPYERTETDFKLMKEAGMNVIRIAESTWSTWEPSDGVFDFSHLTHMLECAEKYDLKVIIGTPTYAIPSWLAKKYPDIMAYGKNGHELYGHRQLFDITNPDYLRHAERIIRKLMEVVKGDTVPTPVIWNEYNALLKKHTPENCAIEYMERFAFYERAKKAYAIIATSEEAVYANILLKKGVVK